MSGCLAHQVVTFPRNGNHQTWRKRIFAHVTIERDGFDRYFAACCRRRQDCIDTEIDIGDLRYELQAKLLRALQESEIERIGGTHPIRTNFRLIAATNVDLQKAVKEGQFREDLFFRLNVIPIRMPALRERIDDLPDLARFFLRRYNLKFRKDVDGIADSTLAILRNYWWPGNIRELENLIERLVAVSDKEWIADEDLPYEFHMARIDADRPASTNLLEGAVTTFERNFIIRALEKAGWNVTATARSLGIPLSTLKFKIQKLEIQESVRKIRGH
jgi:transcriptional regulator with PAS, ATPase and Fis domain